MTITWYRFKLVRIHPSNEHWSNKYFEAEVSSTDPQFPQPTGKRPLVIRGVFPRKKIFPQTEYLCTRFTSKNFGYVLNEIVAAHDLFTKGLVERFDPKESSISRNDYFKYATKMSKLGFTLEAFLRFPLPCVLHPNEPKLVGHPKLWQWLLRLSLRPPADDDSFQRASKLEIKQCALEITTLHLFHAEGSSNFQRSVLLSNCSHLFEQPPLDAEHTEYFDTLIPVPPPFESKEPWFTHPKILELERRLARMCLGLTRPIQDEEEEDGTLPPTTAVPLPPAYPWSLPEDVPLEPDQAKAFQAFPEHRLQALVGSAGVGKTFVACHLVQAWLQADVGHHAFLLAPTGQAAATLYERVGRALSHGLSLTQRLTYLRRVHQSTIHRFLGDYTDPTHSGEDPLVLTRACVMVEEVGMADVLIMTRLMELLYRHHVQKVFVLGDELQLPSISPGAVLRDFLACPSIFRVKLRTAMRHRQHSGILNNASILCESPLGSLSRAHLQEQQGDFHIICPVMSMLNTIRKLLDSLMWPGIIVITQTNALCAEVNSLFQSRFNAQGTCEPSPGLGKPVPSHSNKYCQNYTFRIGDPVRFIQNNKPSWINGQRGVVAEFKKEGHILVDDGKGHTLWVYKDMISSHLCPSYASNVWTIQGHESPTVLFALDNSDTFQDKRAFYTGLTRAQQQVYVLARNEHVLNAALNQMPERVTNLASLLQTEESPPPPPPPPPPLSKPTAFSSMTPAAVSSTTTVVTTTFSSCSSSSKRGYVDSSTFPSGVVFDSKRAKVESL